MAGCYDRSWRVGSKARGTRTQFRLNTDSLMPFKCTYPAHLTDVMDAVPASKQGPSDPRRIEPVSPIRGTRTRAVREYEQLIEELRKENFDLKLRLFLLEEAIKNKGFGGSEEDNTVQVIVELKVETEALRNELISKNQLLQDALDQSEKYAADLRELQDKFVQQQEHLSSLVHLPSEEEFRLLKGDNESLQKSNEFFTKVLTEKDQEIEILNTQLEELSNKNKALDAKLKKSSLTIQGVVYKYYKDIEMIPKELRPVVQSAVLAARENRGEDLVASVKNFKASLCELMSVEGKSSSERKENIAPEMSVMEELKISAGDSKASSSQISSVTSKSSHSSESVNGSEKFGKSESREDLDQMIDILKENDSLKQDNTDKAKIIDDLNTTCSELEQRMVQLQNELLEALSKIQNLELKITEEKSKQTSSLPKKTSSVQTAVQWHLMQSKLSDKFMQTVGHSNNIDVLKEDILTLLLVIEQKDKEITDIEEKLSSLRLQLDMENKKDVTGFNIDEDYLKERKELHQRLAHSCAVNNELMHHLRNLEVFMENLLQHKNLDASSLENISEASSFLSQAKMHIEQSLELSTFLNDQLSICEGSKIFDPNDVSKDESLSDKQSYQHADTSTLDRNTSSVQGRNNSHLPLQEHVKNATGTGKRRLSYSTLHNSALDTTLCDSENVVVLGTSNNEDLILLLNDKGDPEDVLIRNNHSHLDKNTPTFNSGEQHRRRCWESSAMNYFKGEKSVLDHRMDQWCNSELVNPKLVSGWFNPYPSSDSDIWSEPDRDVSLQRIGIDLQKSPVSQRSPRRSRFRDKLSTDDISSQKNESSSSFTKLHTWSKRRKNSDTSRSSFICKKCMSHSQTSDIPSKDDKTEIIDLRKVINDLSGKCTSQGTQLEEIAEELKSKKHIIDALNKEKQELLNYINCLKESEKTLAEKYTKCNDSLSEVNTENSKLLSILKELQCKMTHSDATCNQLKEELENTKTQLKTLESKCSEFEEELAMHSNAKEDYAEKLRSVENEKSKLLEEVDALIAEKNKLLSNVEAEKEKMQHLKIENCKLSTNLKEKSKEISVLEASNKELKNVKNKLQQEKELFETNLLSSNSICDELKNDLKKTKELLENLESKCVQYEKELNESHEFEQNIVKSLSGVKSELSTNLDALTHACKQYLNSDGRSVEDNDNLLSDELSETDKKGLVRKLCEDIIVLNSKFKQLVNILSQQLCSVQTLMEKSKTKFDECKSKIVFSQQQLEEKETEIQSWKEQNNKFKNHIVELQQKLDGTVGETKTLTDCRDQIQSLSGALEESNYQTSVLQKQLDVVTGEVEKYRDLINLKDDEITKLQERIFNMQTHISSLLLTATSPAGQVTTPLSPKDNSVENASSHRASDALSASRVSDHTLCSISNNSSFSSIASEKDSDSNKKYMKKIRALQAKVSMTEKRIEILEKEKSDLRDELLAQVHGEKSRAKSSEDVANQMKELEDLKTALKTKTSFIKDLKSELFKTCNSLVDKQKEVDDLQRKLSASEAKSQTSTFNDLRLSYSDPIHKSTEGNIKELKKHKWELIQGILKHQKQFYERKNIHLGHFEKFKNHIERLRSLQEAPLLHKWESEPLLSTPKVANSFYAEKCDKTLKNLQYELQLDVECLQNLKIFLKRFFIPLVLESCSCTAGSSKADDDPNAGGKPSIQVPVSDVKELRKEHLKLDLYKLPSGAEVMCNTSAISPSDRVITAASVVAHNLETAEIALKNVKLVLEHFKETNSLSHDTPKKTAAKSLLLKILTEVTSLQVHATEAFHLNSVLKSLGLFDISIPLSPSKQDMSDQESLLSEETIALSRSGSLSPMSFENFPSKMFTVVSGAKQKRESEDFEKNDLENKQALGIFQKLHPAGGSQDSIFMRSHFSSPDLGIESDPNHESSAPEQTEKEFRNGVAKLSQRHEILTKAKQWSTEKLHSVSTYDFNENSVRIKEVSSGPGDALHAIGNLQEYELLKKEVQESLVSIKAVLSRTSDGLLHVAKFTSPRKNLEYSTFKAIKDACGNIEVCLQEASKLVDKFWIVPCPSVKELNLLIQQNQEQQEKLKILQDSKRKQESYLKEVMDKLKQAEQIRDKMDKKISRKLVKTKQVIRRAEIKILEKGSQELPLLPKYPNNESACQKKS